MSVVRALWATSVGKKAVMAVTGILLVGFVVGHMLGNLKLYQGEDKFNTYAVCLREMGSPAFGHGQALWLARLVLLLAVALHIAAAVQLTRQSWAARPTGYAAKRALAATYASRTMRWGGAILALFVTYHILHFTVGVVGYAPGEFRAESVYRNVVTGFSVWYVSLFYVAAMVALGLHLQHGVWSMFQTLGWNGAGAERMLRGLAAVVAITVVLGNVSIPVSVLAGLVR